VLTTDSLETTIRGMRVKKKVQIFFVHKRIMSAVKTIEFVSDILNTSTRSSLVSYYCSERSCPNRG
jgi:hypothetical protein